MIKSRERHRRRRGASDFHLYFRRNGAGSLRPVCITGVFDTLAVADRPDLSPCAHDCVYFLNGWKRLDTTAAGPRNLQASGQKIFPETL